MSLRCTWISGTMKSLPIPFHPKGRANDIPKRAGWTDRAKEAIFAVRDDPPQRLGRSLCIQRVQRAVAVYSITLSMSRTKTPTDNAAMEAINGWIKAEIFVDFHITGKSSVEQEVAAYITFFNTARPTYSLKCLMSQQCKEAYAPKGFIEGIAAEADAR